MTRIGLFKYVRLADVPAREACGWMVVSPLNVWSVLMWHCECGEVAP